MPLVEGLSPSARACYGALHQLTQNHTRTHGLGTWHLYLGLLALLLAVVQQWRGRGHDTSGPDASRLVAGIDAALRRCLTGDPPVAPLLPARVTEAQLQEPPRLRAMTELTGALMVLLAEAGPAYGLDLAEACVIVVELLGEVLALFCTEQPRADVEALIATQVVPAVRKVLQGQA